MNQTENQRYSRQIILPKFGQEAQKKLLYAEVLVIGCGGLGGPVLSYLAAAGVGAIGLVEFDIVSLSNLHRQVIFKTEDVGKSKIGVAESLISKINPNVDVIPFPVKLDSTNALEIFSKFDLIVDGSDNFPTRYLVNDACEILGKPFIYGAVNQYEGQVAVFNFNGSASYRDLFPIPPQSDSIQNCAEGGVLGPVAGVIGNLQALEAIKVICGLGGALVDQVLMLEFSEMIFRKIKVRKDETRIPVTQLIDYEVFCNTLTKDDKAINKTTLFEWQNNGKAFLLIDIREPYEHENFNIGGENIPLDEVLEFIEDKSDPMVFYCSTGTRSRQLVEMLKRKNMRKDIYFLSTVLEEFL